MPGPDHPELNVEPFVLDDRPGPARILSEAKARELVSGALDRHFGSQLPAGATRQRSRRMRLALIAALTLGAASAAAAVSYVTYRALSAKKEPVRSTRRAARLAHPKPSVIVLPPDASAKDSVPSDSVPSDMTVTELRRPKPAVKRQPRNPSDLLALANRRRAARSWRAAEHLYKQVRHRFPRSDQAYAATVAAAELRLEKLRDANGALRLYRRALRDRRRYLREEVLFGIATCYRRLRRPKDERRALRAAIGAYPNSPMRRSAERRLIELER